jgi:hemolysin activation/secretion protein
LFAGLGLLLPGQPLKAQIPAPSQVIPRDIAPPASPTTALQTPDSAPVESPPPAGRDLVFTAGRVMIEGAIDSMARANATLLGKTTNRRLTIGDLFAAARELEQAYARAGYILVRVTIPRQRFSDGDGVRFLVTDGTIGTIDVDNVPTGVRPAVLARVQSLIGAQYLTLAKIERQLLLLNTIPGLKLRSALAAGKDAGTVTLVFDGTMERVSSRLGTDNRLPGSLGRWQLTGSSAVNNVIGLGEQAYLTAGSQITQGGIATADNPLMTFGGGISLPVGNRGLTFTGEYLYSRTHPQPLPGTPSASGVFSRVELRAGYPLILRRSETLGLSMSLDLISQSLHLPDFDLDLSRDRYAAARVGVTWQRWFDRIPVSAQIQFSQGIGGRMATALLPLSRQGASPSFSRLEGTLGTTLALPGSFGLNVTLRGQTAFGAPQFVSEQFALDAGDAVSVFSAGSFSVDSGATLRSELRLPVFSPGTHSVFAPYLFAAGGRGSLFRPTAVEQATRSAAGLGGGARLSLDRGWALGGRAANVAVELGRQFSNVSGSRRGSRVSFSLSVEY